MWKYEDPFDKIEKHVVQEVWAIKTCEEGAGCFVHSLWIDKEAANAACDILNRLDRPGHFVGKDDVYQIDWQHLLR